MPDPLARAARALAPAPEPTYETLAAKRAAVRAAARVRVAVYGRDDTFYATVTKAEALRLLDAAVTQLDVTVVEDTVYIEKD